MTLVEIEAGLRAHFTTEQLVALLMNVASREFDAGEIVERAVERAIAAAGQEVA